MSSYRQIRIRGVAILGAALAMGMVARSGILIAGPVICPLRRLTDIPCASCGLTRGMTALAQGDLTTALSFHLAVIPLALAILAALVLVLRELVSGRESLIPAWRRWRSWATGTAIIVIAVGWARNLTAIF